MKEGAEQLLQALIKDAAIPVQGTQLVPLSRYPGAEQAHAPSAKTKLYPTVQVQEPEPVPATPFGMEEQFTHPWRL